MQREKEREREITSNDYIQREEERDTQGRTSNKAKASNIMREVRARSVEQKLRQFISALTLGTSRELANMIAGVYLNFDIIMPCQYDCGVSYQRLNNNQQKLHSPDRSTMRSYIVFSTIQCRNSGSKVDFRIFNADLKILKIQHPSSEKTVRWKTTSKMASYVVVPRPSGRPASQPAACGRR